MKYIIGLGGSIVCPEKINIGYLKRFKKLILSEIKKGSSFVIVVGGGGIAREYQKAGQLLGVSEKARDLLGIKASRLNAELLKVLFGKYAQPVVFDKRFKIKKINKSSLIIGSGWFPGRSTDWVSVQAAIDLNVSKVLFLGKPDYVYTSDFVKSKKAKPIKEIKWRDYFKIIPSEWSPGLSAPVDPVAARLAGRKKIKVIVAGGKDLANVRKILNNKSFKGTTLYD